MKKALYLFPLLLLAACDNSIAEAVKAVKEGVNTDFENGIAITTTAAEVASFSELSAMGPDHVIFKTGDKFAISAEGDPAAIEQLRYIIKDGKLKVGLAKYKIGDEKAATITVTAPSLSAIALAGSGNVTADRLSGDDVSISLAGSGNLAVADISSKNLKSSLAGSGDFEIAGVTGSANYSLAGSGDMHAGKLVATDVKISIAGSGEADIHATGNVKASIAGSGDITVTGGATCTASTVGSGKVHCG